MLDFVVEGQTVAVHGQLGADDAPAVVLLHGAGMDHTSWRYQTRFFAGLGWTALAPDLPGHGRSAGPPRDSIESMAIWTIAFLREVGRTPVVLFGHSMGSLIAVEVAGRQPDLVSALVLEATSDRMRVHPELLDAASRHDHHAIDLMLGWMHTGERRFGGHPDAGAWRAGVSRATLERHLDTVLAVDLAACDRYDPVTGAQTVTQPTLVVQGDSDRMTPMEGAMRLAAQIERVHLAPLSGASHMALSERSAECNSLAVRFLAEALA